MTFILSRKIKMALDKNLRLIMEDRFSEESIKELLIDLREVAKLINNSDSTNSANERIKKSIQLFIDVCDTIAHQNRDRGVLKDYIVHNFSLIENSFKTDILEKEKMRSPFSSDAIVSSLVGMIYFYGSKSDTDFLINIEEVIKRKDDIALCILSLLQDTVIDLDNECKAFLYLECYEGKYILSCSILNSQTQRDARERTGGEGSVVFNFPIIKTNAVCDKKFKVDQYTSNTPFVLKVVRDDKGKFKVEKASSINSY